MKITFEDCLANKRIFHFHPAKHLIDLEIEEAEGDFHSAKEEYSKSGYKWATIKGYYAMYLYGNSKMFDIVIWSSEAKLRDRGALLRYSKFPAKRGYVPFSPGPSLLSRLP